MDDDSKYIGEVAPKKPKRTYDENQPTDTDWSLGKLGAAQDWFKQTYNRPLPLKVKGQGSVHNRLGYDHRQSADVALDPRTPEGKAFGVYLKQSGTPFLAFDRAIPGVATGPHYHLGRPSHRTTAKYGVGQQLKTAPKPDDDSKYISEGEDNQYIGQTTPKPPPPTTLQSGEPVNVKSALSQLKRYAPGYRQPALQTTGLGEAPGSPLAGVFKRQPQTNAPVTQIAQQNTQRPQTAQTLSPTTLNADQHRQQIERQVLAEQQSAQQRYESAPSEANAAAALANQAGPTDRVQTEVERRLATETEAHKRLVQVVQSFTPEDNAELTRLTEELRKLGPIARPTATGAKTFSAQLLYKLAAINDIPSVIFSGNYQQTNPASAWLRRKAAAGEISVEDIHRTMPYTVKQQLLENAVVIAGQFAEMYTPLKTVGATATFAGLGALEAAGRKQPVSEVIGEAAKGAALAGVFGAGSKVEQAASTIPRKLAMSLPTIGAGTMGVETLFGTPPEGAVQSALLNVALHGGGKASEITRAAGRKLTELPPAEPLGQTVPEPLQQQLRAADVSNRIQGAGPKPFAQRGPQPLVLRPQLPPPPVEPPTVQPVEAEGAKLKRFTHRDFGRVTESENQRGVRKGYVRVIDEQGEVHTIKRSTGTGAGNQLAIPERQTKTEEPPAYTVIDKRRIQPEPDWTIEKEGGLWTATKLTDSGRKQISMRSESNLREAIADLDAKEQKRKGEAGFLNIGEVNRALTDLRERYKDETPKALRSRLIREQPELFRKASQDEMDRFEAGLIAGPQREQPVTGEVSDLGDVEQPRLPIAVHEQVRGIGEATKFGRRSVEESFPEFNPARPVSLRETVKPSSDITEIEGADVRKKTGEEGFTPGGPLRNMGGQEMRFADGTRIHVIASPDNPRVGFITGLEGKDIAGKADEIKAALERAGFKDIQYRPDNEDARGPVRRRLFEALKRRFGGQEGFVNLDDLYKAFTEMREKYEKEAPKALPKFDQEREQLRNAADEIKNRYQELERHQARRLGLDVISPDTARNYFAALKRFAKQNSPARAPLVDQAETAFNRQDYSTASQLSEQALTGSHDFVTKIAGADSALQLLEHGLTPKQTNHWLEVLKEVHKRQGGYLDLGEIAKGLDALRKQFPGHTEKQLRILLKVRQPALFTDISERPKEGVPDREAIRKIAQPIVAELHRQALEQIGEHNLKSSDWRKYIKTQLSRVIDSSDLKNWHPLNRGALQSEVYQALKNRKPRSLPVTKANSEREPGEDLTYLEIPNTETTAKVQGRIQTEGVEKVERWVHQSHAYTAERTEAARQVADIYAQRAITAEFTDPQQARELKAKVKRMTSVESVRATTLGQAVQAYATNLKYDPSGALRIATKLAEKYGDDTLTDEVSNQIMRNAVDHHQAEIEAQQLRADIKTLAPHGEETPPEKPPKLSAYNPRRGEAGFAYGPVPPISPPPKPETKADAHIKEYRHQQKELNNLIKRAESRAKKTGKELSPEDREAIIGLQAALQQSRLKADALRKELLATGDLAGLDKLYMDAQTRRADSKLAIDRLLNQIAYQRPGYYIRALGIERAAMVSAVQTAMRNLQSQAVRFNTERFVDLVEHSLRKSFGLDSPFTYRAIVRNTARAYVGKGTPLAKTIAAEHDIYYKLFNEYAGGVPVPGDHPITKGLDKLFGSVEEAYYQFNTVNRLQEFHLRAAEFLAHLDLNLKKEHNMSLERYIRREGIDRIPQELIDGALHQALKVTFVDNPDQATRFGKALGGAIDLANYVPPTVSPIPFGKFWYNSTKFLYQHSPVGILDLARTSRTGDRRSRILARAITGTLMWTIGWQFRESQFAGEKWYELKIPGLKAPIDTRPLGPFSTYLFIGELLKRWHHGESAPDLSEFAEAFGSSSAPGGTGTALFERLFNYWRRDNWDKFTYTIKQELGEGVAALFTPARQFKDLAAHFDPQEGITRDTRDEPFLGKVSEAVPFYSRRFPPAYRPTGRQPIGVPNPLTRFTTGLRIEQPKNYAEHELDRLHFKYDEIRRSTGIIPIDRIETKRMGEKVEDQGTKFQGDQKYQQMNDHDKAKAWVEALKDILKEVRKETKTALPEDYRKLQKQSIPYRLRKPEEATPTPSP